MTLTAVERSTDTHNDQQLTVTTASSPIKQPSADNAKEGTDVFEVWTKYEDIAMHFNDLLIKLRTQALGGVAAISALGMCQWF